MFSFATPRRARRPSLTPMIDVVFLLLVFFMLASQFGRDTVLNVAAAGSGAAYAGPPRLIDIDADGLRLNGVTTDALNLADALAPLMSDDDDTIVLRSADTASVQRLIDVAQMLRAAGYTRLTVVE